MAEIWTSDAFERLSAPFGPIHEQLVERLAPQPGERFLDIAPGTGDVSVRAWEAGAEVVALEQAEPILARAIARAEEAGASIRFDIGTAEYLPYDDASFDVIGSSFGLVAATDHANVAAELARVAVPGARLGFTAWKPNPKLTELYRRFTEEPIDGREAYEWGREEHVEDMLGEDFELDFEDGVLWLEAPSAEEIWEVFATAAPPVLAMLRRLDDRDQEVFHRAFVDLYSSYATEDGSIRAPRRYLLVLGRRK